MIVYSIVSYSSYHRRSLHQGGLKVSVEGREGGFQQLMSRDGKIFPLTKYSPKYNNTT